MKVFVDTNVWLAGRFGHGLCADLLDALVTAEYEMLLDECVYKEFRRIAADKFKVDSRTLIEADHFFQHYVTLLPQANNPAQGVPDPDDAWIIAAVLTARADLFVTGDKALLDLDTVDGLPIVDPRRAYLRLRGLE